MITIKITIKRQRGDLLKKALGNDDSLEYRTLLEDLRIRDRAYAGGYVAASVRTWIPICPSIRGTRIRSICVVSIK
ncbi:MAG: hypothetical protein A2X46_15040 [Lentisphaerae bacterium GWF2_57_35]|nr:MAG: hypothetical protein A2X46_15040 [Lentisphaerae bacterium GWF2_57_35]